VQGQRGKGKTNYLKLQFSKHLHPSAEVEPLWVVDIRNEYTHIPNRFGSYVELNQFVLGKANFNNDVKQYRICFNTETEYQMAFRLFTGLMNCHLIVDEADALFTNHAFLQPLTNIFLGSRNNAVNIFFVGKRPFLIPILVRSQADKFVIFRIEEERDIKYLEGRIRSSMPKDPFKLEKGEAIIIEEINGEKIARLEKFPKFEDAIKGK
jgi:hypothetical protein